MMHVEPETDPSPEQEIERLARTLRQLGDEGSQVLGDFYSALFPTVRRLCRGVLATGAGAAEDIAQDAMLRLVDRIDSWDPARPFLSWQRTVVINMCRNHLRSESRRTTHEDAAAELRSERPAPDPADTASRREIGALVEECLALLPPREREAFVLVDLEHCSAQDAADVMGVAASTVRAALSMARRRLRDALAPRLSEQGAGS